MKNLTYTYNLEFRPQNVKVRAKNQEEADRRIENIFRRVSASQLIDKEKSNLTVTE